MKRQSFLNQTQTYEQPFRLIITSLKHTIDLDQTATRDKTEIALRVLYTTEKQEHLLWMLAVVASSRLWVA